MNSKVKTQNSTLLEVCCGTLTSAIKAQEGGAHRIELCDNLNEGGTTPSAGMIKLAKQKLTIPVFVLIRPRSGDFLYSDSEFELMKQDILFCKEQRVEGVVLGMLNSDGTIDQKRTGELVALARPMQVTFHRAFDRTSDPFRALEDIISLGIDRILTSGQASSAILGVQLIKQLNNRAGNKILIMPGGGISERNVIELITTTGVKEVHASLRSAVKSRMRFRNDNISMEQAGEKDYEWMETDRSRVQEVVDLLGEWK